MVVQMATFKFGDRLVRVEDCHRPTAEVRYRDRTAALMALRLPKAVRWDERLAHF